MGAGSHKRRNEALKAKSFSSDAMKKTTEITHVLFPLLKQESQGRSNKMSLMMPKKEKTFSISMTMPVSHTHTHTHTHTPLNSHHKIDTGQMYLNDQLILQGHLKLFQECHHLCLRLQKCQLRGHQQHLSIVSIFSKCHHFPRH